jgi:4-amino-4-deoxychorismate lyase
VFRLRVLYREEIEKTEFIPHVDRTASSLKLVSADDFDYSYKYADRRLLESLFEQRGECDEILIVRKGFITDTSISNIVFRRTDGAWITPDTPLLKGTMRMLLLESGAISEIPVRPEDLGNYSGAKMINCMMGLDSAPLIEMENIGY